MFPDALQDLFKWKVKPSCGWPLRENHFLSNNIISFYAANDTSSNNLVDSANNLHLTSYNINNSPYLVNNSGPYISYVNTGAAPAFQSIVPTKLQYGWPITIIFAVQLNSNIPTNFTNPRLFGIQQSNANTSPYYIITAYTGNGKVQFAASPGGTNHTLAGYTITPFVDYVMAFTMTNTGWYVYVNGRLFASGSSTGGPLWSATSTMVAYGWNEIATINGCQAFYWGGVWNREFTPSQHRQIGSAVNNIWQIFKPQIDIVSILQKTKSGGNIYNIPISFNVDGVVIDNPGVIYRPNLLLIEETDINNYLVKQSSIDSILNEDTDLSLLKVISKSKLNTDITESTDILENLIKNSSIASEINEDTDFYSSCIVIAPIQSVSADLEVTTTLDINSGLVYFVSANFVEDTTINSSLVRESQLNSGLLTTTDISENILKLSPINIGLPEQTDFYTTYVVTSPTQNVSADLEVSTNINISPGIISKITASIVEQTDINTNCIRSYNSNNNIIVDVSINNNVIRGFDVYLESDVSNDIFVVTGRFRGESISLVTDAVLFASGTGSYSLIAVQDNLSVDADLGVVMNRLTGTDESFNAEIDVASLVIRGIAQTTTAGVSSDVATNPGRNCYVIPFISVETDVNGKLSAIYSPTVQLQVEDSLTVLVGVAGAVIPLQQTNFQLTMNTVLNFTLTLNDNLTFTVY